jgi:hypothetical protein
LTDDGRTSQQQRLCSKNRTQIYKPLVLSDILQDENGNKNGKAEVPEAYLNACAVQSEARPTRSALLNGAYGTCSSCDGTLAGPGPHPSRFSATSGTAKAKAMVTSHAFFPPPVLGFWNKNHEKTEHQNKKIRKILD